MQARARAPKSAGLAEDDCESRGLRRDRQHDRQQGTLVNFRRCQPMPIKDGRRTVSSASVKGDLPLRLAVPVATASVNVTIRDVYYHERFDANLLSWGRMRRTDGSCTAPWPARIWSRRAASASTPARVASDAARRRGAERVTASSRAASSAATAEELLLAASARWARELGQDSSDVQGWCHAGRGDISRMPPESWREPRGPSEDCAALRRGKAHRRASATDGLDKGSEAGRSAAHGHVLQR